MTYRKKRKEQYKPKRRNGIRAHTKVPWKRHPDDAPSVSRAENRPLRVSEDEAFSREEQSFERLKRKCLRNEQIRGKFIAVLDGRIVGIDENDRKLAKRVYDSHGYRPIYIGKVTETRRIVEIPSPERAQ